MLHPSIQSSYAVFCLKKKSAGSARLRHRPHAASAETRFASRAASTASGLALRAGGHRRCPATARTALDRAGRECPGAVPLLLKQGVQLAALLERVEIVRPSDVGVPDEHLRYRAPAGGLHQLQPRLVVPGDVDLLIRDVLVLQQPFRPHAVGARLGGVDLDGLHFDSMRIAQKERDCAPSTTTQAPAIQLARGLPSKAMVSPIRSAVANVATG